METSKPYEQIASENQELRWQLEEAKETIEAIRTGQVDALVVKNGDKHQLYTLKSADQTYRMFIEKMNEGVATINEAGFILYSNSRLAKMVNLPLDKVIGLAFESFVAEESKEKYRTIIEEGWKNDCKEEIVIESNDHKQICCLISCNSLELDEGPTLSLIITDLTIHKENTRQLRIQNELLEDARNLTDKLNNELEETVKDRTKDLLISREHFKLLANHITQMTWTNLPDGEVNYYNQRWYDYTGLTFEETQKWGWEAVVHPDDIEETKAKYIIALQSGQIFEVENRYRRADGTYRWHLNRALPLKNEKGEIVFWVGTATDIEEQKRALERKDEFIGVASHELKTPLTSLKGYLQLMNLYNRDEMPPRVKEYLSRANESIKKLQHLVDDLLDVSKINAGRLNYNMDTIGIKSVIDDCVEDAAHIYPAYDFEVDNETDFIINGNPERLEQVLMNLINNAVKYSPLNNIILVKSSKYGNCVRVSVTDFGIGLTDEQQYKIFERFYRVEDKKYMTSGLGMGLYISSGIIHTHNGKIGVESEPGKGSTFYFDLPLVSN